METYGGEAKPSIAKAVIIGGIVGGVLGIIPVIQGCNFCCCLWFALAGVISVLIYKAGAIFDVTSGMGALLGFVSGIIASVITGIGQYFALNLQFKNPEFWNPDSNLNQRLRDTMSQAGSGEFMDQYFQFLQNMNPEEMMAWIAVGIVMIVVIGTIVSTIAGIITAAVAGKSKTRHDEPPPYQLTM